MATELGKAYVQIMPSAKGISGSISKVLNPEVTSAGNSGGLKLGTALWATAKKAVLSAAAGLSAAVTGIVAGALSEGAKLEQSLGGVETLFGKNAQEVIKNAKVAFKEAGVSANDYMTNVTSFSASLIQSLDGDTAKAAKIANVAMVDMSDNANKFGSNIEDIQNAYQGFAKQNYTMLDNLKLGYGGTKTEMQRLLADASKLEGREFNIGSYADIIEAIRVIQKEMNVTGTTSKEAAETLSGSFAMMKAAAQDALGNLMIGEDVEQSMKNLAESAATWLFGNLIPAVGRILQGLPGAVMAFITAATPIFIQGMTDLAGKMGVSLTSGLGQSVVSGLQPIKEKITEVLGNLDFSGVQSLTSDLLPTLGGAFETITSTVVTVITQGIQLVGNLWNSVQPIIKTLGDVISSLDFSGIQKLWVSILPALEAGFKKIISIAGPMFEQLMKSFGDLWNSIQPIIKIIAGVLQPVFEVLGSFVGGVLKGVMLGLKGTFDLIKLALDFLAPVIQWIADLFTDLEPIFSKTAEWVGFVVGLFANLSSAGKGMGEMIKSAWTNIKTSIEFAGSVIGNVIGGIKGFFTGLKNAGNILKDGLSAVWNAIKSAISTAGGAIKSTIEGIKGFFTALKNGGINLKDSIVNAWKAIKTGIETGVNGAIGFIKDLIGRFEAIKHIDLFGAGKAIMDGFLKGLKSMWSGVTDFVGGIGDWIKDNKGPIAYDRKLLVPAGQAIMYGLNQSLQDQFETVKATVRSMGQELVNVTSGYGIDFGVSVADINASDYQLRQSLGLMALDFPNYDFSGRERKVVELLQEIADKDANVYLDGEDVTDYTSRALNGRQRLTDVYGGRRRGEIV